MATVAEQQREFQDRIARIARASAKSAAAEISLSGKAMAKPRSMDAETSRRLFMVLGGVVVIVGLLGFAAKDLIAAMGVGGDAPEAPTVLKLDNG